MDCKASRLINEYIDGALAEDSCELLEAHFTACEECTEEIGRLLSMRESIKSARRFGAPEGFTGRVMEAVAEDGRIRNSFRAGVLRLWRSTPITLKLAEAAAAAMVIAAGILSGGVLIDRYLGQGPEQGYQVSSLSLDYLEPTPPGSIAGAYFSIKEGADEQ